MKINENTKIVGQNVLLVPYKRIHVLKYHDWMQSRELRELTASEQLTLEEEYRMQETWHNDEDKCTFIVLDKQVWEETGNEILSMIGDTNLFLLDTDLAEAEIMIAEKTARGQGKGKEAMLLMLKYGCDELNIKKFLAKIGMSNTRSITMFQKMHFTLESKSQIFKEVTLQREVSEEWEHWLRNQTSNSYIEGYKSINV